MKREEDVRSIVNALKQLYPDALCSLQYDKDYELLFAVRLSAQCTDERVNKVTPALFERFPTLEAFAEADPAEVANTSTPAASSTAKAGIWWAALRCCPGLRRQGALSNGRSAQAARRWPQNCQPDPGRYLPYPGRSRGRHPLHPYYRKAGPYGRDKGSRQG